MSFYPQPNEWTCGPFALKYALVMHGKFVNETDISNRSGTSWWNGTNELGLVKAAKYYGCNLKSIRRLKAERARITLCSYLKKGIPCILCVDEWSHWITIINYEKKKFIIVDSEQSPVIQIIAWETLRRRWIFYDDKQDKEKFDLYPLIFKSKKFDKPSFTLKLARELRKEKNYDLANKWDIYFSDLISITELKTKKTTSSIPLAGFIKKYSPIIIDNVSYWHGFPSRKELKDLLKRFQFVAETYHLQIDEAKIIDAISAFSAIVMMYSCGKYGMSKIYL